MARKIVFVWSPGVMNVEKDVIDTHALFLSNAVKYSSLLTDLWIAIICDLSQSTLSLSFSLSQHVFLLFKSNKEGFICSLQLLLKKHFSSKGEAII